MRMPWLWCAIGWCTLVRADDQPVASAAPTPNASRAADSADVQSRPRGVPLGIAHPESPDQSAANTTTDAMPAKYSTADRWILAGYNNNEIVYTIIVSNEDTRILHCTALMQGWYFDNGKKLPISDRQSITVFPNEPAHIGNWMDMDQQSGATYSVKCRTL